MKTLSKLFASAALALATATTAYASPVTGSITISGNDTYNSTSITFNPTTGTVNSATGSLGIFAPKILNGLSASYLASLTSFTFANASGVTVFSVSNGASMASFTISSLQTSIGQLGALSITGTGFFNETGYNQTNGAFSLTSSSTGAITGFQLTSGPNAVTPEPSSLVLLGTGLVGAAGMIMFRRRRSAFSL